jgi:hypothetical protein
MSSRSKFIHPKIMMTQDALYINVIGAVMLALFLSWSNGR